MATQDKDIKAVSSQNDNEKASDNKNGSGMAWMSLVGMLVGSSSKSENTSSDLDVNSVLSSIYSRNGNTNSTAVAITVISVFIIVGVVVLIIVKSKK